MHPKLVRAVNIYSKIVRSLHLLSALLNWFKQFYGLFCKSNMHCTLDFRPDETEKNLNELLRSMSIILNALTPRSGFPR